MAAHQDSPSLGFSRQEHWSGLPELVILPANGEAGDLSPAEPDKPGKKGCGGVVGSAIALTSLLGIALAGVLTAKKFRKKED